MSDHQHQEIIIIKRGNEEEEGHHGGAWKIAFADFMTAMMALFLVLWLINAANEETKRAVASYFNPIKLVDRNRSVKGVEEQKGEPTEKDETGGSPNPDTALGDDALTTKSLTPKESGKEEQGEREKNEAFFADPMAALERIEASVLEKQGISNVIDSKDEPANQTEFTDPFNSDNLQKKPVPDAQKTGGPADAAKPEDSEKPAAKEDATKPVSLSENKTDGKIKEDQLKGAAEELETAVREEVAAKLGPVAAANNSIKVTASENGILIQITDTPTTPMFDIGAAVPRGETVITVNAVAKALAERPGPVHVYGHTDARKFDGPGNQNWRLSMDRAQSVYFMLLRAGLEENRFAGVSGFADRKPLAAGNPLADQNRRIEIFLEQS